VKIIIDSSPLSGVKKKLDDHLGSNMENVLIKLLYPQFRLQVNIDVSSSSSRPLKENTALFLTKSDRLSAGLKL